MKLSAINLNTSKKALIGTMLAGSLLAGGISSCTKTDNIQTNSVLKNIKKRTKFNTFTMVSEKNTSWKMLKQELQVQ